MIKKTTTFLIGICLFFAATAQEDMSNYFEDSGLSTVKNIAKIGFDPINGKIPFILEHQLSDMFSLEGGIGLVSLARQTRLYTDEFTAEGIPGTGFGFNVWLHLKLYLDGFHERFYTGINPRLNLLGGKKMYDIVFATVGYQVPLPGKLTFDIHGGVGIRLYKSVMWVVQTKYEENGSLLIIPIEAKLGYAF